MGVTLRQFITDLHRGAYSALYQDKTLYSLFFTAASSKTKDIKLVMYQRPTDVERKIIMYDLKGIRVLPVEKVASDIFEQTYHICINRDEFLSNLSIFFYVNPVALRAKYDHIYMKKVAKRVKVEKEAKSAGLPSPYQNMCIAQGVIKQ